MKNYDFKKAKQLIEDAVLLEKAGAFSIVLEGIPEKVAELITKAVSIPTIGIGAGPGCDGQVLVSTDVLGLSAQPPRFAQDFSQTHGAPQAAIRAFIDAVRSGAFPTEEHSFR